MAAPEPCPVRATKAPSDCGVFDEVQRERPVLYSSLTGKVLAFAAQGSYFMCQIVVDTDFSSYRVLNPVCVGAMIYNPLYLVNIFWTLCCRDATI